MVRRQYITHPRFQIIFTLSFVLGVLFIFLFLACLFGLNLSLYISQPSITDAQKDIVIEELQKVGGFYLIAALISTVISGLIGVFLSYKFVGPLARLENWLEQKLQNPDQEGIFLRPGDELENVANTLSDISARVQSKGK